MRLSEPTKLLRIILNNYYNNINYNNNYLTHTCSFLFLIRLFRHTIVERESDNFKRWIQESIHIRTNSPTMNRDEGAYQLSPIWNQSDFTCFAPTAAYLRLVTPLVFLSFEKDACQASKPSTIILYFLAMFKEPFNFIF